ncbi:MAG: NAD(P)H-dependent oxidoreductase subunit E [Acidimicrobiaceae bacterium]|nr:NAD(P)H-dependent oxidoreductase subunit E [Acidimicrobiaceae bacterium]
MTDIYLGADRATDAEAAAVDEALRDRGVDAVVQSETERLYISGRARRLQRRHFLLPALHALQNAVGWISPGGINYVADVLGVPPAEAFGVATFYDLFRTEPPDHEGDTFHVCVDAACQIAGYDDLAASVRASGGHVHLGPCLGQCERAPALFVQGSGGRPDHVPADAEPFALPQAGDPSLRLLRRIGVADPESLESYRAHGGYEALQRAGEMGADAVLEAVAASGLSGRGGAAFPTGVKWRAVAAESGRPKHVVANCDESEPGTFKDRIVMEHDPFAVIESMTIAGLATGAQNGWIYIRGEYPLATARLQGAIDAARAAGLLGPDAAGTGHDFDIAIWRGAGAYICGEETALFNSLEGFRGEPRNKPPFPTTHGLFGEPTAINNPETLLNVLDIILDGPDDYRTRGTERSPGTKLLCLSGKVGRPGLYEVPFGTTLGVLLELAGGVAGTGELQAVLMGGAAGSFVGPDSLDLPLTLEDTRAAGTTLGSGVVMAFDSSVDMTDVVVRIAEFFRDESCGQCVPCRVGAVRQHETLVQMQKRGSLSPSRRALIDEMAEVMVDASICGLGHTAASAVRSALSLGLIASTPS